MMRMSEKDNNKEEDDNYMTNSKIKICATNYCSKTFKHKMWAKIKIVPQKHIISYNDDDDDDEQDYN